ncbi:helix-turn-helix domain-containing protein [Myroides albus]|nr:helix-turn-helix domain-containing protein [Myroides albus]UVD79096.1 helix-turn-helix domain-containing protein [Myroides albus]
MLDKPKNQISTVINSELNESFYSLLAKYRVEYAKKLLETNRHLLLDGVMLQSGFNSRSTFIKYFKEFVGESPSAYRKTFEYNL